MAKSVRLFVTPGQNTGVGSLFLLQGIFPTQGLNSGLLHCPRILYQLSHKGSPRILVWVAYPFSRGSSWPRDRTQVSHIPGRFFTNWAKERNVCVSQSCPTFCSLMDYNPLGSSVRGILQARILEWVAIPFSRVFSQYRDQTQVFCIAGGFFTVWATRGATGSS